MIKVATDIQEDIRQAIKAGDIDKDTTCFRPYSVECNQLWYCGNCIYNHINTYVGEEEF